MLIAIIGALAVILAAVTAPVVPSLVSNWIVTPRFQITPSLDFSSVNITNVGGAAAHQVRITLVVPGNQTGFSKFSSENATWIRFYDPTGNQTVIVATLPRLGEQGVVSIRFDHFARTLEAWINSNERGYHQLSLKGSPSPGQPIDNAVILIGVVLFFMYGAFLFYTYRKRHAIRHFFRLQ